MRNLTTIPRPIAMAGILTLFVLLTQCTVVSQFDPISAAKTSEQRAYAIYGTYVVMQERAVRLVRDRRLSKAVRKHIQHADRIAKPSVDLMLDTAREVSAARRAINQGSTSLRELVARLDVLITRTGPRVDALVAAVKRADK